MQLRFTTAVIASLLCFGFVGNTACTAHTALRAENDTGGDDDDTDDDDTGDDDDEPAEDGGKTKRDAGSPSDGGQADAGDQDGGSSDVDPAYLRDPNNCGAKDHRCLGTSCSQGLCQLTRMRTISSGTFTWLGFDENRALVTHVNDYKNFVQVKRGPTTPSATDTTVLKLSPLLQANLSYGATFRMDSHFDFGRTVGGTYDLRRFTKDGSTMLVDEKTLGEQLETSGLALDETNVFYMGRSGAVYAADHDGSNRRRLGGAATVFGTTNLVARGADVYLVNSGTLHVLPKSGGAPRSVNFAGAPDGWRTYLRGVTDTRVVAETFSSTSKDALWSGLATGGAATVLVSGVSVFDVAVDTDFVYWIDSSSTSAQKIFRRRIDGSDKATLLAVTSCIKLAIDGDYLYLLSGFDVDRVAK